MRTCLSLMFCILASTAAAGDKPEPEIANSVDVAEYDFPAQWDPKLGIHVT